MEMYVYLLILETVNLGGIRTEVSVYFSEEAAKMAFKQRIDDDWVIDEFSSTDKAQFPRGYEKTAKLYITRKRVLGQ